MLIDLMTYINKLSLLDSVILYILLLSVFFLFVYKVSQRRNRKVRARTPAQAQKLRVAKKCVKLVLKDKLPPDVIVRKMGGFEYEIFVLLAMQTAHKNIRYFFPISLTGDRGIDGAFIIQKRLYIIQTKHYSGTVQTSDIEAIGVIASKYRNSQSPYAKRQRKHYGYNDVCPIFVTTGRVTEPGYHAANTNGVLLLGHTDMVRFLRKKDSVPALRAALPHLGGFSNNA